MKQYIKIINNKIEYFNGSIIVDGKRIFNPTEEQILLDGWTEYVPPVEEPIEEYQPTYEEKVVSLIRQMYTIDDEIAILRQKEIKQDEYQEWYNYCEQCKQQVKDNNI